MRIFARKTYEFDLDGRKFVTRPLEFMDLPDGVEKTLLFRLAVAEGSIDELVLALSEATPLLQEGLGAPDNASFAAWVATNDLVRGEIDERTLRAAERNMPRTGGEA